MSLNPKTDKDILKELSSTSKILLKQKERQSSRLQSLSL